MSIVYAEKIQRGSVAVSEGAISELVLSIIRKYDKNIYITNDKGKRTSKVYKTIGGSSAGNISVFADENGIKIRVYVILTFGKSIKKTTEELSEAIRKEIHRVIGRNPKEITVVITGIKSKKIVRRNIEVTKRYDV